MANINVTWTNPTDTSDISSYEVYVCDGSSHFTTAAAFQTKLDAIYGGATVTSQGLDLIESIDDTTKTAITSLHSLSSGSYHFGIASKNQGGYKVEDDNAVFALVVS
jgi:hypothetical protein